MLLYIHLKYDIFLYQLFVVFSLSLPFVKSTVSRLCSLLYRKKQAEKRTAASENAAAVFFYSSSVGICRTIKFFIFAGKTFEIAAIIISDRVLFRLLLDIFLQERGTGYRLFEEALIRRRVIRLFCILLGNENECSAASRTGSEAFVMLGHKRAFKGIAGYSRPARIAVESRQKLRAVGYFGK